MSNEPTEAEEQFALVQWLELHGYKFTAIPNATWTPSYKQKYHNRLLGLRPGLPDLLIVLKCNKLLFLEMKRTKGGQATEDQKEWISILNQCGVWAQIAKGTEEAINIIKSLDIGKNVLRKEVPSNSI